MRKRRKICGVGINDADYSVVVWEGDKIVFRCKYYDHWYSMMRRCYSKKALARDPTYAGCSVHTDWHSFVAFKDWMEKQPWEGRCLDKDLLVAGNRIYGPETCVFVPHEINMLMIESNPNTRKYLIGVHLNRKSGNFISQINSKNGPQYLGSYPTELEAHLAWKRKKCEFACALADELEKTGYPSDQKAAAALRTRYA